jgi:ABC-type transport system substrate-binding protein
MLNHKASLSLTVVLLFSVLTTISCTHKADDENALHIPMKVNIKGLDPANSNDLYVAQVISTVYETLYHYQYLKRPIEVEPSLATTMPEISKDGLTYTIHLKSGLRFQDSEVFPDGKGRDVTAQDIIYSWKRLADPAIQSEGFWVFDGKVKGINEWRLKKGKGEATYDTPVEGLKAVDDHTLVIQLLKPYFQLVYILTMPYTAILPHEAIEKYGAEIINHPVGTGPYKLQSWTRNNQLVLVKNANWHGENYPSEGAPGDKEKGLLADAGKPLPFADKVVFYEITEDQPRWLNFMKGQLDLIEIPKDNFDASMKGDKLSEEMTKKGMKVHIEKDPDLTYTAFNMLDPILGKNELVRKAMSLAFDGPTQLERFYNGRGIVAQSPIPPGIDGYDADFKNPYKDFSIEKAKEMLAKAGYPEGKGLPEFEFSTTGDTTNRQLAEYFQQNMSKIGIKIRISTNSWPQFTDKLREKKAQIWQIAWSADYPDAENFLQLLYGPNESPGPNASNYHSKEYDALYDQAAKLPPSAARTNIYRKMRDVFVKDMPWIPNLHRLRYEMQNGWLMNGKDHLIILDMFKYMRVDREKKKALKAKL